MKPYLLAFIALFVLLSSCSMCGRDAPVTEGQLKSYITAIIRLREAGVRLASGEMPVREGMKGYEIFKKTVTDSGFRSASEFLAVNTRIVAAMTIVESGIIAGEAKRSAGKASEEYWRRFLDDPDIPESAKEQVRKGIEEAGELARKGKEEIGRHKEITDPMVEIARKIVDEKTIALVRKHREELEAAYSGRRR